jgi:hypothetical protein
MDFWLFPNYFTSFKDPRKILWPLVSVKSRDDKFGVGNLVFRTMSVGFIGYMIFQFFQDEKNIEDLKDLKGGIQDLLDYGQDFIMGHQLGDGNKTEEATF